MPIESGNTTNAHQQEQHDPCHLDNDRDVGKTQRQPAAYKHYCANNDLSFTSATDSVTLDDTFATSPGTTLAVAEDESFSPTSRRPRPVPQASPSFLTDPLSLQVPTMHRSSTLGGAKQLIVLDPHLIAMDRLGPSSLEAMGIEIVSRPSSCYYYQRQQQHHAATVSNGVSSNITAMIPRVICIRHALKPILRRTENVSSYKPPAPIKRVQFKVIKPPGVATANLMADDEDYKNINVLTKENQRKLWWTKDELKEIENREWFAARNLVRSTPRFAEAFERVLIECFKNVEKDAKLTKEQLQSHGGLGITLDEALEMMTSYDCRGLERLMVHWLSVGRARHYFQIRKNCSVALMKAQSRWKNVDESSEHKERKIAAGIRNYTLFSEKLAQLVAQGDAAIVDRVSIVDRVLDDAVCPKVHSEMLRPSSPRGRVVI
jgi:hypothetical protein